MGILDDLDLDTRDGIAEGVTRISTKTDEWVELCHSLGGAPGRGGVTADPAIGEQATQLVKDIDEARQQLNDAFERRLKLL